MAFSGLCVASGVPSRLVEGYSAGEFMGKHALWRHQWSEVYFGPYGWVTVDATWKEFNLYSSGLLYFTHWTYQPNTLSSLSPTPTLIHSAQNFTTVLMTNLYEAWPVLFGVPGYQLPAHISGNIERLLGKALFLSQMGEHHQAFILLCEAYLLLNEIPSSLPLVGIATSFVLIIGVLVIIYFYRRHRQHNTKFNSQSLNNN